MTYSIGEISRRFGLPQSTLRYYDKEGLLPDVQRCNGGIRRFDERTVEALRVIECLKKSGMEIRDIKQFMIWCGQGPATYEKRLEMFRQQREKMQQELERMYQTLAMIDFKCWYYTQALQDGNEDFAADLPNGVPEEARRLYEASHPAEPEAGANPANSAPARRRTRRKAEPLTAEAAER